MRVYFQIMKTMQRSSVKIPLIADTAAREQIMPAVTGNVVRQQTSNNSSNEVGIGTQNETQGACHKKQSEASKEKTQMNTW
ncbi:MAG TPA: hypothetical protein V6C86_17510 [Oculatellaceae cyanobacterium]